ncbi:MAG: DUF4124 domain-containing protein [Archangiaceae bacterium]|nr:DUF4124 domain-containing protein [Archangiaceae bacterium]
MALALVLLLVSGQTIYSWTDADGVPHYTDNATTVPKGVKVNASLSPSASPARRWRTDVEACVKALTHADERRNELKAAEKTLASMKRAYEPCQRHLEVCQKSNNCARPPAACDVNVKEQEAVVKDLRDEVDELPAWLEKMGRWGCFG